MIRDDGNDEGTEICNLGDFLQTYDTNVKVVIRDDGNDEGTEICFIQNDNTIY